MLLQVNFKILEIHDSIVTYNTFAILTNDNEYVDSSNSRDNVALHESANSTPHVVKNVAKIKPKNSKVLTLSQDSQNNSDIDLHINDHRVGNYLQKQQGFDCKYSSAQRPKLAH